MERTLQPSQSELETLIVNHVHLDLLAMVEEVTLLQVVEPKNVQLATGVTRRMRIVERLRNIPVQPVQKHIQRILEQVLLRLKMPAIHAFRETIVKDTQNPRRHALVDTSVLLARSTRLNSHVQLELTLILVQHLKRIVKHADQVNSALKEVNLSTIAHQIQSVQEAQQMT